MSYHGGQHPTLELTHTAAAVRNHGLAAALSDITHEYNITTVINTHDMNSVLGIGENIVFISKGYCEWTGNKDLIFSSDNQALNDFVFATDLFQEVKEYIVKYGLNAVGAARRHSIEAQKN